MSENEISKLNISREEYRIYYKFRSYWVYKFYISESESIGASMTNFGTLEDALEFIDNEVHSYEGIRVV